MLTTMATDDGFRRQVTFRIGPEDAPILEATARTHGGIQAGILAALRAYAAQRLQPPALPTQVPPPEEGSSEPAEPKAATPSPRAQKRRTAAEPIPHAADGDETDRVELNVGEAALVLDISPATLRDRIKRGAHPGRLGENGFYLAEIPRAQLRASDIDLSQTQEFSRLDQNLTTSHFRGSS
jgi:hypothetical protein